MFNFILYHDITNPNSKKKSKHLFLGHCIMINIIKRKSRNLKFRARAGFKKHNQTVKDKKKNNE